MLQIINRYLLVEIVKSSNGEKRPHIQPAVDEQIDELVLVLYQSREHGVIQVDLLRM